MYIQIHRGQNQIGGSIIEIASATTRIVFDVGLQLDSDATDAPQVDGLFQGDPSIDGVFISHYHADHLGLAGQILQGIPLYMGEKCYAINRYVNAYVGRFVEYEARFVYPGVAVSIGDIKITPYLCDHSAYDAYMYLAEVEGHSVLYTGDFRANGRKSYSRLLQQLPKVDILITEGTTLSRGAQRHVIEKDLELLATKAMKGRNPVFVLQAATNIDRIVTVYKAAKRSGKLFLQDLYMAEITSLIGGSIPNPRSFRDVRVFMTTGGESRYPELQTYGSQKIGREQIAREDFVMCVRPSMERYLEKLSKKMDFSQGLLFYAMWEGYRETDSMKQFLDFMTAKGITVRKLHTSGHADPKTILHLMERVKPEVIIPIHTENTDWFETNKSEGTVVVTECDVFSYPYDRGRD